MKTIATFGCSYTAGHGTSLYRWVNWPTELALILRDEYKIYNCAKGGTSIDYSIYTLSSFLKYKKPDVVLLQLSTPWRLTWVHHEQKGEFPDMYTFDRYSELPIPKDELFDSYKNLKNYYAARLTTDWGFITPGTTTSPNSPKKLANFYYRHVGKNLVDTVKYLSYIHYVKTYLLKDIPHLILTHDGEPLLNVVPEISVDVDFKTSLGRDYFDKHIVDNGRHLSHEALQKVAKIMYHNMKTKGLL